MRSSWQRLRSHPNVQQLLPLLLAAAVVVAASAPGSAAAGFHAASTFDPRGRMLAERQAGIRKHPSAVTAAVAAATSRFRNLREFHASHEGRNLAQRRSTASSGGFLTLSGKAPMIVARGGSSNIFPDMTTNAYSRAIMEGADAITCTVMITQDSQLLCRPGPDLGNNTDVHNGKRFRKVFRRSATTIDNAVYESGYFTPDFSAQQLQKLRANQPNSLTRPFGFDGLMKLQSASDVMKIARKGKVAVYYDIFSPSFFAANNLSIVDAFSQFLAQQAADGRLPERGVYVACTDLAAVARLKNATNAVNATLLFKMESGLNATVPQVFYEQSTKKPFSSFTTPAALKQLAMDGVSGVMVPKTMVVPHTLGPLGDFRFIANATTLVEDAHAAGLTVHVYAFMNDDAFFPWDYGADRTLEYFYFTSPASTEAGGADAIITDNPVTARSVLGCYIQQDDSTSAPKQPKGRSSYPLTIGEASGFLPPQSSDSIIYAINQRIDVIVCNVQMSSDGFPLCRPSPDVSASTDILTAFPGFPPALYPEIQEYPGIFTFDLPASFVVNNLTALQTVPFRPPVSGYVMDLVQFLAISLQTTRPLRLLLDLQYPSFLKANKSLDMVAAVAATYAQLGPSLKPDDIVMFQSMEAGALKELGTLLRKQQSQQTTADNAVKSVLVQKIDTSSEVDPSTNLTYAFYASEEGLKAIASYAGTVNVNQLLVLNVSSTNFSSPDAFFSTAATPLARQAHAQGLKVWVSTFRNEPVSLLYDYQEDVQLKLHYYVNNADQVIDGIVTEFPSTALNYRESRCYYNVATTNDTEDDASAVDNSEYSLPMVVPGFYLQLMQNLSNAGGEADAPAPAPAPSGPDGAPAAGTPGTAPPPPPPPKSAGRASLVGRCLPPLMLALLLPLLLLSLLLPGAWVHPW